MKPTAGRCVGSSSWCTDLRPIPARAGIGPSGTPRDSRRVIVTVLGPSGLGLGHLAAHLFALTFRHVFPLGRVLVGLGLAGAGMGRIAAVVLARFRYAR